MSDQIAELATAVYAAQSLVVHHNTRWTDDQMETLRTLWADDKISAGGIAKVLGQTRNAVLGKVHRMGLPTRRRLIGRKTVSPTKYPVSRAKPKEGVFLAPVHIAPVPEAPTAIPCTLLELTAKSCRYPFDVPGGGFLFCNAEAENGSYCKKHRAICWTVPPKRAPGFVPFSHRRGR